MAVWRKRFEIEALFERRCLEIPDETRTIIGGRDEIVPAARTSRSRRWSLGWSDVGVATLVALMIASAIGGLTWSLNAEVRQPSLRPSATRTDCLADDSGQLQILLESLHQSDVEDQNLRAAVEFILRCHNIAGPNGDQAALAEFFAKQSSASRAKIELLNGSRPAQ
jgi:hypothetical protein